MPFICYVVSPCLGEATQVRGNYIRTGVPPRTTLYTLNLCSYVPCKTLQTNIWELQPLHTRSRLQRRRPIA